MEAKETWYGSIRTRKTIKATVQTNKGREEVLVSVQLAGTQPQKVHSGDRNDPEREIRADFAKKS